MTKRNFKKLMVTLLAVMMFFTSVPSTAMAATYSYTIGGIQRSLDVTNGKTTLDVDGKSYDLTKALVTKDAACAEDGTTWVLYKNGAVYWWNYDLQGNETVITLHKYTTGVDSLEIEGDYVTGLNLATGLTVNILSLEGQKKVLGITSEPSQPTDPSNPTQPDGKPNQPTEPSNPEEPSKPSQPTKPEQKPNQSTTQPSKTTTKKNTTTAKIGKVIHKGRTYYVYSTKGKVITKFSLTRKGGKFTWRGYTMKNVMYVGIIKKSKNVVVLTKKTGYKFNFSNMKRTKLYDVKKYGKPIRLEYDNDGCTIRVVTKKPRRFSIKNK